MNRAEVVFKAIDILGNIPQNAVHYKGVSVHKDIAYGENQLQKGDLYFKREILNDGEKHPVILYIHGGGFIMGDKKYRVSVSEYYAKEGYFVYSINYRMPPQVDCFGLMNDCIDALNFLSRLSEKYNFDLDNIVITGDSSGGFVSSYLAALKFDEELRQNVGVQKINVGIKGLMLMCGIYDMETLLKGTKLLGVIPQTARMILNFPQLKNDFSNLYDYPYINYMSPMQFVNENWCPTFICWSDDDIICQKQGEPMAEKLSLFTRVESHHVKGIQNNHCYHLLLPTKHAADCMGKSLSFLAELFEKERVEK